MLTITRGANVGQLISLPIGEVISFGRADECTHRFDDAGLSRVHARIMCIAGQYVLNDAGSTNGSYLNDARLQSAQPLRDGDRIQFGTNLTLRFSLVDEAEEAAMRKVYESALRDGLTGVFNRKHLEERLDAEIAFAQRHGTKLSLIILDVDFFKKVNDNHGHPAGDSVLRHMGQVLLRSVRTEDIVARYGGEEFVVLLRGIDRQGAWYLAERLRMSVAAEAVRHENISIAVTISSGVADFSECSSKPDKLALLALADGRLYQAKQQGRNRVI